MQDRRQLVALLDKALEARVPGSERWARKSWPITEADTELAAYVIQLASPIEPEARRLELELRADGDIEVRYYIEDKKGSPFEAHFITMDEPSEAVSEVASFVADLIDEKLILGMDSSFFRGGRVFLPAAELRLRRPELEWTVSWRGTHDWSRDS